MVETKEVPQSVIRTALRQGENSFWSLSEDSFAMTPVMTGPYKSLDLVGQMPGRERTIYKSLRTESFSILGVSSRSEIAKLIDNPEDSNHKRAAVRKRKAKVSKSAYERFANQYGMDGAEGDTISAINRIGEEANAVISYLKNGFLGSQATEAETTNEIQHANNPVDLILTLFNHRKFNTQARFEAERKLWIMHMIASIHMQERAGHSSEKLREFDEFLNQYVWREGEKVGASQKSYIWSKHDSSTYESTQVEVLGEKEGIEKKRTLNHDELLTPVMRRTFVHKGREIPVYMTTRDKNIVQKVIKMLRKDSENPEVAIEDDLGFMGVFDTVRDADAFQEKLQEAMTDAKLHPALRDITDTLSGEAYTNGSDGSSTKVKMRKFFLNFPDKKIEIILHTNKTFIDYYNQYR